MKKKIFFLFIILCFIFITILYMFKSYINVAQTTKKDIVNEKINDKMWCATFQLCWNELKNYIGTDIKFIDDENNEIVKLLNNYNFNKDDLDEKDYYIKVSKGYDNLKADIYKDLEKKFKMRNPSILDGLDFENKNGIIVYSYLYKEFKFRKDFEDTTLCFVDSEGIKNYVNGFGFDDKTKKDLTDNVELLYYNGNDFAIKLKTKEDDEVILYKTSNILDKSLNDLYNELNSNITQYDGTRKINNYDVLSIPNIKLDKAIRYHEICNKEIKDSNTEYIAEAIQSISFNLNKNGGKIKSESSIITDSLSAPLSTATIYLFNTPFVIFLKEKGGENYYFAIKISNTEFLDLINY